MIKQRLIVLSDIWGNRNAQWLDSYLQPLKSLFDVKFYSCPELASIDLIELSYGEQLIHDRFVNGGIEQAVHHLSSLEKQPINLLGFSIGGTIGWKFALKTGCVKRLYCLSSTRLRKEKHKPHSIIKLYFGENDPFKPPEHWFNDLSVNYELISNQVHSFYRNYASDFLDKLIADQSIMYD